MSNNKTAIIGAGLSGCECALTLARHGVSSTIFEMKPHKFSPAHSSPFLAELVCSNSLRSDDPESAVGVLKNEMRALGSSVMQAAEAARVPAGKALAVDRALFSSGITALIKNNPLITLEQREIKSLDQQAEDGLASFTNLVIAAGPLAGEELSASLSRIIGASEQLYFYDAIAPIVAGDSLNMDIIFRGSRYSSDEGDYLNCPMNSDEYFAFYRALIGAEKVPSKNFEQEKHFEGCMPIEAMAERGERTLTFGPLKPVGFVDPRTGTRPYAIVQLRAENLNRSMFNLVGCQTKLTYVEQERIFRMIPGLEKAEFIRHGSMHRNTFVNAPVTLNKDLSLRNAPHIFLAGQITGVEGYVESAAIGLWLGIYLAHKIRRQQAQDTTECLSAACVADELPLPPPESALGALLRHLRTPVKNFQPSNIQYGLMPELEVHSKKTSRRALYSARAGQSFAGWLKTCNR
ncbi:MAG: methylenetetrahydrofolate--tRNA-(uracil(54)-C(5))-methyltransferase (FADH(2)-oxidizing) TrmFO [Deltaproteobacteria bacterium]|nr:methylenetetrahydrofolate--tRNA-(uracil(54)-C(5))-methyltransferase (FADH(2)-oxidizing) TrmFO [Deltaproteobacteria bacterium]